MRIRVTQQGIDEGVQNNCFHCPVARAIKRVFKADEVWVREIIIVKNAGSQRTYVMPAAALDFIELFDAASLNAQNPSASLSTNMCEPVWREPGKEEPIKNRGSAKYSAKCGTRWSRRTYS